MEPHMNIMALIVASLIPMSMGIIYYHPKLMGQAWMSANGFTKESIGKGPGAMAYILTLVTSMMLAFFFWGWVTGGGGQDSFQVVDAKDGHSHVTFSHGLFHGLAFSLLVLFPVFASMAVFERKSAKWAAINLGYWSFTVMLMCGILSAWR